VDVQQRFLRPEEIYSRGTLIANEKPYSRIPRRDQSIFYDQFPSFGTHGKL
jgi:hypothetical protein